MVIFILIERTISQPLCINKRTKMELPLSIHEMDPCRWCIRPLAVLPNRIVRRHKAANQYHAVQ